MKFSRTILLKWALRSLLLQSAIGVSALFVPPLKPHNQMPTAFYQLSPHTDPQLQLRERAIQLRARPPRGGGEGSAPGWAEGLRNFALIIVALPVIGIGLVFGLLLQATMLKAGLSPGTRVAVEVCIMGLGTILPLAYNRFSPGSTKAEAVLGNQS
jgi:hypothetical protein